jgi:hypothetical protein
MTLAELRENFDLQYNLFNNVRAALGAEAVWSIGDVVDFTEVAFPETIKTIQYNLHWGEVGPVSITVNKAGLTWLDLYVIADALIRDSGDLHHVYIESFTKVGDDLYLHTGS